MLAFNRRLKVGLWDVGHPQRRLALAFAEAGLSGDFGAGMKRDGAVLFHLLVLVVFPGCRLNLLQQLPTATNRTGKGLPRGLRGTLPRAWGEGRDFRISGFSGRSYKPPLPPRWTNKRNSSGGGMKGWG